MRRIAACAFVALAALITGCASLPPLEGRTATTAFADTAGTTLGRALATQAAANPGKTGIHAFRDPRDAFAARVLLAAAAERSLDVQYYQWNGDQVGYLLFEALWQAAERGVRVRLLLDDLGTVGLDPTIAALDAHPNIEVRLYNPVVQREFRALNFLTDFTRVNRRMHNKSFTADNQATIIGGRNVGDEYFDADDGNGMLFADLDVLAIGPAVSDVSRDFDRYWASESAYPLGLLLPAASPEAVRREAAAARARIPETERATYSSAVATARLMPALLHGTQAFDWSRVTMLSDDPAKVLGRAATESHVWPRLKEAVGTPQRELLLVSAYFVPGEAGAAYLTDLVGAGTAVSVLTNSLAATDVAAVHAGYARRRKPMVLGGVTLWELKRNIAPPDIGRRRLGGSSSSSLHAKTVVVDRDRVFVGSFNFDPRSARLNTELGFVIPSPALASRLSDLFHREVPWHAYRVVADSAGDIVWQEQVGGETVVHTDEPDTGALLRLGVGFLSLLPIEGLL